MLSNSMQRHSHGHCVSMGREHDLLPCWIHHQVATIPEAHVEQIAAEPEQHTLTALQVMLHMHRQAVAKSTRSKPNQWWLANLHAKAEVNDGYSLQTAYRMDMISMSSHMHVYIQPGL